MRIGLVLGAGGSVGRAFNAGVVAALQDVTGWDARDAAVIVGTSAGSVDAALLRAGLSPADLVAHAAQEGLSPDGARLLAHVKGPASIASTYPWQSRPWPAEPGYFLEAARRPRQFRLGIVAAAMLPEGIVSTRPIFELIDPFYGGRWPERPLWINAVRLRDGWRVVFGRDPSPTITVAQAVCASCAIPGWFTPLHAAGERFVDGGVYSLLNVGVLKELDLDLVIVSSSMSAVPSAWRVAPVVDGALRAASHLRLVGELRRLPARMPVIVLEPNAGDLRVMGTLGEAMESERRQAVARWVRGSMRERLWLMRVPERMQRIRTQSVAFRDVPRHD